MRWLLGLPLLALAACGEELILRPLLIHVQNVSSAAETVVLSSFKGSAGVGCPSVTVASVQALTPTAQARWERASGAERRLEVPPLEEPSATLVVHSADGAGTVLQVGCLEVRYEELEIPEINLRLR